jgi:four helix bundle protein
MEVLGCYSVTVWSPGIAGFQGRIEEMAKVERFEDLICWQKARELVNLIYSVSRDNALSKDYGLRDQLRRAAVSSMTNTAEGFARFYPRDFMRFLDIAQSSAVEVRSLMYVVQDQGYLPPDKVADVQAVAEETTKTTKGLLRYLYNKTRKGGNRIAEPAAIYKTEADDINNSLILDVPEELINIVVE